MPHYGTLHDFAFQKDVDDIRGSTLYGVTDEKLGKIDDVVFDHTSGELKYVVVDTGGWFTHKKFLVPAERVHAYEKDRDAFQVDVVKSHIERNFPKYDDKSDRTEKDWADYDQHYKRAWDQTPVQHRDDRIDLDVTPANFGTMKDAGPGMPLGSLGEELQDIRENPAEDRQLAKQDMEGDFTPTRLAGKFPEAQQSANKIDMSPVRDERDDITLHNEFPIDADPPANPTDRNKAAMVEVGQWHPRMRKFEDVLKKNRVDVTASCASCAPAKDRAA